ncbi:flagellar motor stator protein MotA [Silanimonas sp.]|uniref:flagellar motor stator protein MotA n=1 Tax=Silanimonas sp. TaxID=1929290 RepID=UPI0022CB4A56|nr:flagellar motor stator protein MotA [Silanimonas sp.]MCZ8064146.1 flagellar motor stator protein MotA [Silanimonas sp.]
MFVLIGYVIILVCVFGGFVFAGGNIMVIVKAAVVETTIIGGGALGAFVAGNTMKNMKASISGALGLLKGPKFGKADYIELLKLLYELLMKIRKEGLMAVESHVENPEASAIFQKYPKVLADHHLLDFITDCLRLMIGGNMNPHELEAVLEAELDAHHKEAHAPSHSIQTVADGLPAFGIVAAVLGIVKVMEYVGNAPPEVIGQKVASALVGTFLGILLGYGFVGPVASAMGTRAEEDSKPFELVKIALLASVRGYPPPVAIEFARKQLFSDIRPSFADLETELKGAK